MPIVEQAVLAASPSVKLKKQKQRGGKSGMKPMALNERQRTGLALKWIRDQVIGDKGRGAPGKKYEERLAREMVNILRGASPVLDRKKKMHEEAMANRCVLLLYWCRHFLTYLQGFIIETRLM